MSCYWLHQISGILNGPFLNIPYLLSFSSHILPYNRLVPIGLWLYLMDSFPDLDYQINPCAVKTQWIWVTHQFFNTITSNFISFFFVLILSKSLDEHMSRGGSHRVQPQPTALHYTHGLPGHLQLWAVNRQGRDQKAQWQSSVNLLPLGLVRSLARVALKAAFQS